MLTPGVSGEMLVSLKWTRGILSWERVRLWTSEVECLFCFVCKEPEVTKTMGKNGFSIVIQQQFVVLGVYCSYLS